MFKSQHRRPRKPAWIVARAALVMSALFFAALTVIFWVLDLWATSPMLAVFIGGGFALSAIVTPAVVPKLAHARGGSLIGLACVCLAFGAVDTIGLDRALQSLESRITQPEYAAAMAERAARLAPLDAVIAAEMAKRDAITLPKRDCRCPQTRAADLEAFQAQRDAHQRIIDAAKAEIDAAPLPARRSVFDSRITFWLSLGLQVALAVGLLSLEAARERVFRQATDAYEARLAAQRKARQPASYARPTLAVRND